MKALLKMMAAPVVRPLRRRLTAHLEDRLSEGQARLDAIEARVARLEAGWEQLSPRLLDAASRVGVLQREMRQMAFDQQDLLARLREEIRDIKRKQ